MTEICEILLASEYRCLILLTKATVIMYRCQALGCFVYSSFNRYFCKLFIALCVIHLGLKTWSHFCNLVIITIVISSIYWALGRSGIVLRTLYILSNYGILSQIGDRFCCHPRFIACLAEEWRREILAQDHSSRIGSEPIGLSLSGAWVFTKFKEI